jgi:heterodisulfide reductase subunit A
MSDEAIRVGVFVCDCGSNIAGVVNVPEVTAYAAGLEGVAFADEGRWSCSSDYIEKMKGLIQEHALNRVVIASCTPRTHEPLFKRAVKEAGVNPYLLEFVSIREQVSWVHMREPDVATEKAKDLIRMGVAKARLLEEGEEIRLPVKTECLVIGGGMAGMTAALHIADQGFHAVLVERGAQLGGLLNRISGIRTNQRSYRPQDLVKARADAVDAHPNIKVYTNAQLTSVEGYIGNFKISLHANGSDQEMTVSTVIVATGMQELSPEGVYDFGDDPRVITQLALEERLREGAVRDIHDVVFINCVNSRNSSRGCCHIGCNISVKNALALKNQAPNINVTVLHRDLSLVREEKQDLRKAMDQGIQFLRFSRDRYPVIAKANGRLEVSTRDIILGREFQVPADLIVLTTGFEGDESVEQIKGLLKVSANADLFFQEAHVKLGPLDFPSSGIHLCGCARSPKSLRDTIDEAAGAAMRASIPMKRGYVEAEGIVADIDLTDCKRCGLCAKMCPYNAIELDEDKTPKVIKALCKGCGLCAADCPTESITIVHYSDPQILAQVAAALENKPEDKIIAFVCHWCALGGVDMAGVSRLQYPANARLIRVMCSARVSIKMIQRAFELGAAGVLVAGCEFPTCHYIKGNYAAETRIKRAKKKLAKAGYDPERLWNVWCSAADGPKFARTMRDMVKALGI